MRHDFAENDIFFDAFGGGFGVFNHVAAAAVQQAVVTPGGAVGEVSFFNEGSLKTALGQIVHNTRSVAPPPITKISVSILRILFPSCCSFQGYRKIH